MNDLIRLQKHYMDKFLSDNYWQDFNCHPYYISQRQYAMIIKILKDYGINSCNKVFKKSILDIGAGNGNFLLSFLKLGADIRKITAVELIKERCIRLKENFSNATIENKNYLDFNSKAQFDIITIMAVLSSILDDNIREEIFTKAYHELKTGGILIIYDYNKIRPIQLADYYKAVSFRDIISKLGIQAKHYKIYKRCYLNEKISKLLCIFHMGFLIPFLQSFKIFNGSYSFLVIQK